VGSTATQHAIEVENLHISYPGRADPAVAGISFAVATGSVVAVLGPNGAGKTSTVEAIEGYRTPAQGKIRVLGLDPFADRTALAPRMGVMLQRNGVYLSMGPARLLRLFAAYYEARARDPEEVLNLIGLRGVANTPWRRLSGGEQQRLSLGLALIGRPDVTFLDEPTAGMDAAARQTMWKTVRDIRSQGGTVLMTTHDLVEAEQLADEVIIIDHGKIVASGSPESLRSSATDDVRFSAPAGLPIDQLRQQLGVTAREVTPGDYQVMTPPSPTSIAAITAWLAAENATLGDLRGSRQRLEEVFLRLTSDAASPSGDQPRSRDRGRSRRRASR
jgi:ABC-2 type transport system ATP-binding protein